MGFKIKTIKDRMRDFDPNVSAKGQPEWATFVPGRTTEFKTHASRGHALNAVQWSHGYAILYRWIKGRWEEIERVEYKTRTACEECSKPGSRSAPMSSDRLRPIWVFKRTDRPKYRYLCQKCRTDLRDS